MTLLTGGTETDIVIGGITYRVHTFTASGTLTVHEAGEVEYLVVGGGGGTSPGILNNGGGGGGGGGVRVGTIDVPLGALPITVGAGGLGRATFSGLDGGDGEASSLGALIEALGGGGGGFPTVNNGFPGNGRPGASGGGGGESGPGATGDTGGLGGAGTPGQGHDGADGIENWAPGAGGGAGGPAIAAPNSGANSTPGPGIVSSITGAAVEYGKGGTSSRTSSGSSPGTANTGGGANGANETFNGSAGGSGIVVVRYVLPDSLRVAASHGTTAYTVWNAVSKVRENTWPAISGQGEDIAFSPDLTRLALVTRTSPGLYVIDVASRTIETGWPVAPRTTRGLSWSPNGQWLAVKMDGDGSNANTLLVIDVNSKEVDESWPDVPGVNGDGGDVKFSPDGQRLAVASFVSPYLYVLDVGTKSIEAGWPTMPGGTAGALAWSPNGYWLAYGRSGSPGLVVVAVGNKSIESGWPTFGGSGPAVAFSPDSTLLAVGGSSGAGFNVIDVQSRTVQSGWPSYTTEGVGFSPDGEIVAVGTLSSSPFAIFHDVEARAEDPGWQSSSGAQVTAFSWGVVPDKVWSFARSDRPLYGELGLTDRRARLTRRPPR